MVLQQKNGNTAPFIAADLIERLPDEGDPQQAMEEKVAQDMLATSLLGRWYWRWTLNRLLSSVRWL